MAYHREFRSGGKKKIYTVAGAVILVALIAVAAYFWSTKSNQGTIAYAASPGQQARISYKVLNGKYISFIYNGEYAVINMQPSGDNDLETYLLSADTSYQKQLAVDISTLPGGNLNNNSSYNFRKTSPYLYTSQNITVDGSPAVEWLKNDGSEITVQIPNGGKLATLSFTTGSPTDQLQPEVNALMQSFSWKQRLCWYNLCL
jgi:hypothetical protein